MKYMILICWLVVLHPTVVVAAGRNQGYFETNSGGASSQPEKKGYFFYDDQSEPEETADDVAPKASLPQRPQKETLTSQERFTGIIPWNDVYSMHPDDFQELIEDAAKWAIQKPEEQGRVEAYIALQYVAIERAERFEQEWQNALQRLPVLDPTVTRPPTRIATQVELKAKAEDIAMYINAMREELGLILFTRQGCSYCDEQKRILSSFITTWDWRHLNELDIDLYPDVAAEYGVSRVPDLFLVGNMPNGEVMQRRLRAGLTTKNEIEIGMLEAYSQWYLGKPYMPQNQADERAAFEQYYQTVLKGQQDGAKPSSGGTSAPAKVRQIITNSKKELLK